MIPGTKSIGRWARSQAAASSRPGELAALDPVEERGPPVDLALVEAVGPAEVLQAPACQSTFDSRRDAVDELGTPGPAAASGRTSNGSGHCAHRCIGDQPSTKPIR